jgi:HSP20 family protein
MLSLKPWRRDQNGSGALANRNDHPLSLFRNEFDTLFDRFFGNWPMFDNGWANWGLDLDESEETVTLQVDAPGFEPGDFDIQVSDETLKITAVRKVEKGKNKGAYERRFERYVTLPAAVDADKVAAKYRNGVLELTLPKTEQSKWKKIAVKG